MKCMELMILPESRVIIVPCRTPMNIMGESSILSEVALLLVYFSEDAIFCFMKYGS